MTEPLVATVDVSKVFGGSPAVAGVTLAVERGEVVGLLGANGAGKTTLMRMILGLTPPSSGTVALFGAAPSRPARSRLGYVPQGLGLYPDLTAAENVEFVTGAFGVPPAPLTDGLANVADCLVGELPLGIRRRLAFHTASCHRPELLILDEPTSGVGPLGRARLWEAIDAAAIQGVGVLVSTHDMAEAEQCDRVVILSLGTVVAAAAPADVRSGIVSLVVTAADRSAAYRELDRAGLAVSFAGAAVRVVSAAATEVGRLLGAAGIDASIAEVPATFDEAFVALSTAAH
jgi:ABC-2 type transport system ATP-binding protein/ribosome-dependent ATPase